MKRQEWSDERVGNWRVLVCQVRRWKGRSGCSNHNTKRKTHQNIWVEKLQAAVTACNHELKLIRLTPRQVHQRIRSIIMNNGTMLLGHQKQASISDDAKVGGGCNGHTAAKRIELNLLDYAWILLRKSTEVAENPSVFISKCAMPRKGECWGLVETTHSHPISKNITPRSCPHLQSITHHHHGHPYHPIISRWTFCVWAWRWRQFWFPSRNFWVLGGSRYATFLWCMKASVDSTASFNSPINKCSSTTSEAPTALSSTSANSHSANMFLWSRAISSNSAHHRDPTLFWWKKMTLMCPRCRIRTMKWIGGWGGDSRDFVGEWEVRWRMIRGIATKMTSKNAKCPLMLPTVRNRSNLWSTGSSSTTSPTTCNSNRKAKVFAADII